MRIPARVAAVIVALLPLALLPTAHASPSGGQETACLRMGSPVRVLGHATFKCTAFHPDIALHLPRQTATTAYGYLEGSFGSPHILTTAHSAIPVRDGVGAKMIRSVSLSGRLIVRATLAAGEVIEVEPWLYIDDSAVTSAYVDRQVTGRAIALGAPSGIPASLWMRMVFAQRAGEVVARIVNYRHGVKAHGSCHAAMLTPTTTAFVRQTLGSRGQFTASWNPAMHAPGDSEVVLQTPRGPSYMARGPLLAQLMTGPWQPIEVDFVIHGNPVGTIAALRGAVAPRTPVLSCP